MNINTMNENNQITTESTQLSSTKPRFTGVVSINPNKFGFIKTEEGLSYFMPPSIASSFIRDDIVTFEVDKDPRTDKFLVSNVELSFRPESFWMGEVEETERGLKFKPDDTLLARIDLAENKVKFKKGDVVQIRIKETTKNFRYVKGYVVANLGDNRKVPQFNERYALTKERIPTKFSAAVFANAEEVSADSLIPSGYKNLETIPFVTIDGESTKDFDDAVYAEVHSGYSNLKVAVADVSHFVKENSALDVEAKLRGTSVYLPQQVVPMFPEILSNGVCSLVPNERRLALVCDMKISHSGEILEYSMYPASIVSHARLTYTSVTSWLDSDGEGADENIMRVINALNLVHKNLRTKRAENGFLEIDRKEPHLIKDNDGTPIGLSWVPTLVAHLLVEDCMLAANKCAAKFLIEHDKGALFRHHAAPSGDAWAESLAWFKAKGVELPEIPSLLDFSKVQAQFKNTSLESLVDERLRRALDPAIYDNEHSSHFSLGFEAYTHFTSPIRRYPDLMVHRAIHAIIANKEVALENDKELAEYCGIVSKRAARAERFVWTRLKLQFIAEMIENTFTAKIVTSSSNGCKAVILDWDLAGFIESESLEKQGYIWDKQIKLWVRPDSVNESISELLDLGQKLEIKIKELSDSDMTLQFSY